MPDARATVRAARSDAYHASKVATDSASPDASVNLVVDFVIMASNPSEQGSYLRYIDIYLIVSSKILRNGPA